ncbi:unnamed protein product [Caenorhabditis nigoni]
MDFYLTFLMKPIPIFPVIGGYTTGLLFNSFGVSSHIQMVIQMMLMGVQECAIFCAFLRKHQAIVTIDKKFELKKFTYWGIIVFVHIEVIIFTLLFDSASVSKENQKANIRKHIPNVEKELLQFPSLEIYDREVNYLITWSLSLVIIFATTMITLISLLSL